MKNTFTDFKICTDDIAVAEMESILKAGKDLLIVTSPSEYFDGKISRRAIALMNKYPAGRIFVTSSTTLFILEQVREKAASGAGLIDTYIYAETLAKANVA